MATLSALVQPVRGTQLLGVERRHGTRRPCALEATSRSLDGANTVAWGGRVADVSAGGLKLSLCFPFKPGTLLALDVQAPAGAAWSLIARVVHVHDHRDGSWTLGCAFVKPLAPEEVGSLLGSGDA